jgi:hypothetical protein
LCSGSDDGGGGSGGDSDGRTRSPVLVVNERKRVHIRLIDLQGNVN